MDEVGEGLNQLLAQPGLQWGQGSKLQGQRILIMVGDRSSHVGKTTPLPRGSGAHQTGPERSPRPRAALASLMILIRTQLFVEDVMSLKNSGARDR